MTEKRVGRQSPTVGFTLPYTTTRGAEAVELYNKTGRTALDWQRGLIYDIMATDADGLWIHSRFGYSVPRQNGKNEVIAMRELWGLTNGERVLHSAHRTATSRAAWERLVYLCECAGIHEIKGECKSGYKTGKSKGQEWIEFDEANGGGKVSFRTRSTTGGLGETFDLLVIDEAQEYQPDQESALKYTIVSSGNPQTIYLGTPPTVYSSGTIFPQFRNDVLQGTKKHAGWAEWSIEDPTEVSNVDAWYLTNPSLGYTLTERAIEDEIGGDEDDFLIQRLGLWIRYNQKSAISAKEWDALETNKLPAISGQLCVGIKFARDGGSSALSIAGKTADGRTFVECINDRTMRDGVEWLAMFLKHLNGNYVKAVVDGDNGKALLEAELKEMKLAKAYEVSTRDFTDACAFFEQSVFAKTIVHMHQPAVRQIVSNCEKRAINTSGGFGYKSTCVDYDIAIMDSIILAVWGLETFKPKRAPKVSY